MEVPICSYEDISFVEDVAPESLNIAFWVTPSVSKGYIIWLPTSYSAVVLPKEFDVRE